MNDKPEREQAPEPAPAYNPNLAPLHPDNVRAAEKLGWKYDVDFACWCDAGGHLIKPGEDPPRTDGCMLLG